MDVDDTSPRVSEDLLHRADRALLEAARAIIAARKRPRWHEIGAALRTASGRTYCAVHLEADVGRVAVCAEPVALGMAVAAGDAVIDTIVAVDADGDIVSPCGMCRELIGDYAPAARVLLPGDAGAWRAATVAALLPFKSPSGYLSSQDERD